MASCMPAPIRAACRATPSGAEAGAMAPPILTVRAKIAWSYANLARAHAALSEGATAYSKTHHIIRNRLYHGIMGKRMSMRSLLDDEAVKLKAERCCSYCGSRDFLSIDHLLPRTRGGSDSGENLVLACKPCNTSKGGADMMEWMLRNGNFPSILIFRRYIKLLVLYYEKENLLDLELSDPDLSKTPFNIDLLPTKFPSLDTLRIM